MQTMMIPVSCLKQKKQKERKMKSKKSSYVVVSILAAVALLCGAFVASAQTAAEIDRDVDNGISKLYSDSPAAKELSTVAKGILVFPDVVKGGLIIGGQYGKGALRVNGKTEGYYNNRLAM
jgi:lipid-binding SYLF domain-containing protein